MADPQIENGYTRIANELLEALLLANLSKRQLLVVFAVIRQTYGFNRKSDRISGSQIAGLTGLRRNHCSVAMAELIEMKILHLSGSQLGVQKDHEQWSCGGPNSGSESRNRTVPKQDHISPESGPESQNGTVPNQDYSSPNSGLDESQNRTKTSPKTGHTKDSKDISKDSFKDKRANALEQRFESWWQCYPKKRNRGQALKAWKSIKPDAELMEEMIVATEAAKKSPGWQKARGQYIPYPATWLRAQGWLDQFAVDIHSTSTESEACAKTIENLNLLFGDTDGEKHVRKADGLPVSRV